MGQRKKRPEKPEPKPVRIASWEEIFTGPNPSLTPEQRYDWAYDRLMEAYQCTNWGKQRALLLSIIKNPVEDKQLMTAAYATLSFAEVNAGLEEASDEAARQRVFAAAEQYALKALELKPTNTVAPTGLFWAQSVQKRHFDAFETFAKYNIDLGPSKSVPEGTPLVRQREDRIGRMWMIYSVRSFLEEECKDAEKFEVYFDLHIRYREAFYYARFLLEAALGSQEVPASAKAVLCDDIIRYETVEAVGAVDRFLALTELLFPLCAIKDKPMLKKCLTELDALRPACWDELGMPGRCAYYGNRLCALNTLGCYEEALAMAPDIGSEYRDNTVLNQLMYACIHLERVDQAVPYGRAAVSLGGDETDMEYLGRAYLGQKDYTNAVEYLKASIWYIKHSDGKETYDFGDWTVQKKSDAPKEAYYLETFKMLIQAYVGQEKYVEAEAAYQELCQLVPENHELSELRLMLVAQRDLIEKSGQVEKQCLRLKKELEASRNTVDEYVQRMKNWSDKLVKCQMLTDDEVSDELWESAVRDKMDEVLRIAVETERASSGRFYERKLREVTKRFPKLSKPLRSYFATAEQLYTNFKGNTAIDFAPVLVEYCKVVEGALWEYLPQSEDYQAHCRQWLSDSRNSKTLGGAFSIAKTYGKPLYRFRDDLEKLKKLRNDSAHVGVDRVPDVEWVRAYLWQGDLLDELAQAES